jgi:predicted dehydrogenase
VDVAALCDIYDVQFDKAKQAAPNAKTYHDHRQVLDLKEIDATLIAVPDHWHAPIATDALNAGKDVYVEKPLTLKPAEGPGIVKAARINNRVCQVGMQQRSGKHYLEAKREYMDTGKLGKVTLARTWWHGNSYHLRKAPDSLRTKPADLDWAHYLGRLKWRDWDPLQYWNWRAYLDFGGGQVTDLFTHWIDVVHMFMGQDNPVAASAIGGVFNYKDGRTAPDTSTCCWNILRNSRRRSKPRWSPASRAKISNSWGLMAACSSTARITNSTPWRKVRSRWW